MVIIIVCSGFSNGRISRTGSAIDCSERGAVLSSKAGAPTTQKFLCALEPPEIEQEKAERENMGLRQGRKGQYGEKGERERGKEGDAERYQKNSILLSCCEVTV